MQHLVARTGVALGVDAPDIDAFAGIHEKDHRDLPGLLVDLRDRVDIGEGVALVAQLSGDALRALDSNLAGEDIPPAHVNQREELLGRNRGFSGQLHVADPVDIALVDADRDIDVLFVGADGDLGRFDLELDVAAIEVKGA